MEPVCMEAGDKIRIYDSQCNVVSMAREIRETEKREPADMACSTGGAG